VRPLSKGVDQAGRCIRALDLAMGENSEFDQLVIMCLRRKAAQYIRKYAGAKQRGGIALQDELLLAEGHKCGTSLGVSGKEGGHGLHLVLLGWLVD
jgi:hypothetical protein